MTKRRGIKNTGGLPSVHFDMSARPLHLSCLEQVRSPKIASPMEILICRLTERGISHTRVPGIVRDVFHIIADGGIFTIDLVNSWLEHLGWGQEVLDETSFQLIVHVLEREWGYRVRHYSIV